MDPFSAFAIFLVSTLLLQAFATQPASGSISPQAFDPGSLPVAGEGTRIIEVFGDVNIDGWMVLGYGDYRTRPVKAGDISATGKK